MRPSDLVFFSSGLAALLYQVAWARLATRTLGADAFGAGVVVATFMGGMALGAMLAGRGPLARARRPERAFAAVVIAAALVATATAGLVGFPAGASRALDGTLTAALLLPTTLAMGATFPLMGRLTERESATLGARTSRFYGANTLGAATGAIVATFLALPWLGLRGTIFAGAAIDVLAALGALVLLAGPASDAPAGPARGRRPSVPGVSRLLLITGLLGGASLALEVVLTRLLVSLTGASVYAFGLVLAAYLVGLGLGARQGRLWLDGSRDPRPILARAGVGAVAAACAGLLLLGLQIGSGDVFEPLANRTPTKGGVTGMWLSQFILAAVALIPPAVAFGLALPAAIACAVRSSGTDAAEVDEPRLLARFYTWNTLGAALGAIAAAWLLLPGLGLRGATLAALAPAVLAWLLAPGVPGRNRLLTALGLTTLLALTFARRGAQEIDVVAKAVGPVCTAVVERMPDTDPAQLALRIDGKVVASSAPVDLRLQRLLAVIPAALHGRVETALVVGLGMGTTAGALAELESLEHLRVIELSQSVVDVGPAFEPWTGGLLDDPRLQLTIGDGRSWCARSRVEGGPRFDLVTADPIHPWTRGSSDLYAVDHFERLRDLLAPGGVASQWLPLYQLSTADVQTVVASWCAAFPRTSAWLTAYDLVLVGSNDPLRSIDELARGALPAGTATILGAIGVDSGADLAALRVADDTRLRAFAEGSRPMVENRPVLEFNAPKSFLAGFSEQVLLWAVEDGVAEGLPEPARDGARRLRQLVRDFVTDLPKGASAAAERFGERLLEAS
ncbi:fused MFS/spermidine synthase [Engelhardtia mirabilis]|uniref:Spermidine synthase n=1 Tax=Engelhardtia mirabilis TaxID=2528011 RepID=A0A518BK69_9BACT|nr:Spermidine synthase [Planctomycetes bacterium Pla133]QDV01695.1 Spermidine synthase [Planctomycetes bacterium Pla86]